MNVSQEVLKFLKNAPSGMRSSEIAAMLNVPTTRTSVALYGHYTAKPPRVRRARIAGANEFIYYAADATPAKKPEEQSSEQPVAVQTPTPSPSLMSIKAPPLDNYVTQFVDGFCKKFVDLVIQGISAELEARLRSELPAAPPKFVASAQLTMPGKSPEKPRLPKVLICGLLPQQSGFISSEFHHWFDFDFVSSDVNTKLFRSKVDAADIVITMVNFTSHWMEDIIKTVDVKKLTRNTGGMSSLREKLAMMVPK